MASGASVAATASSVTTATHAPVELSNEEINGVRLEKAVELGAKVYRIEFHKTFPKDPAQLYTALQNEKQKINRYIFLRSFIKWVNG